MIGAAAGYLALWSVFWLFKLATGKGHGLRRLQAARRHRGLARLADPPADHPAVVPGGAVVGIALIVLRRHGRRSRSPFGPYLAAAGLLALSLGQTLTEAYLGLL